MIVIDIKQVNNGGHNQLLFTAETLKTIRNMNSYEVEQLKELFTPLSSDKPNHESLI